MRFETKRDYTFPIIFLFVFIVYACISIYVILTEKNFSILWGFSGVLALLGILFYTILKTTYFIFEEDNLVCKSLFVKRSIPYSSIRKIEKQKGLYAGLKMSTSMKGLVIYYNKFDELLISPEKVDEFIAEVEKRKTNFLVNRI